MEKTWTNHSVPDVHAFKDKRVILRVDWNLPVTDKSISDFSRFDVSVPFLKELSLAGAKVIILTHFGEKEESLEIIADHVTKTLPFVTFIKSTDFGEIYKNIDSMSSGSALLLENVRLFKGELDNTDSLSLSFSSLGDVFINDAFSVSHREQSSVVGIAKNKLSFFGPNFIREVENLSKIFTPEKPALLVVGGAKISTKLPLINHYLDQGIKVFVGGAMVHNIFKERGINIGKSVYDPKTFLTIDFINHPLLLTPIDVTLETGTVIELNRMTDVDMIVDCGPQTVAMLEKEIKESLTVIANGPLGLYEKGWLKGSEQVLNIIANSTATSYIGGGDTVSVANSMHLLSKFGFVSLGGGAMLDFISSGTLPGIDAVTKQQ